MISEYESLRKERALLVVKILRGDFTADEERRLEAIDTELDRIEDQLYAHPKRDSG